MTTAELKGEDIPTRSRRTHHPSTAVYFLPVKGLNRSRERVRRERSTMRREFERCERDRFEALFLLYELIEDLSINIFAVKHLNALLYLSKEGCFSALEEALS